MVCLVQLSGEREGTLVVRHGGAAAGAADGARAEQEQRRVLEVVSANQLGIDVELGSTRA